MKRFIFILFAILIFFVPIVLWPFTSEVFEFNKIVLTYALTSLIVGVWTIRCIIERKFIFRRTILDIPLFVFFASQLISTLLSIDVYTSIFGYYSRFNGGLISTVCYLLLYWAFVSNLELKDALNLIKVWFASAIIVSIYGVAEHFGIDKSTWVQDVQSRVFSSLGQPNWLAAWVTALIPVAWAFALRSKIKSINFWYYFGLSVLLFWVLIFTKSRSGFLGFGIACILFWGAVALQNIKKIPSFIAPLLITGFAFIAVCLISGTQWTPSIGQYFSHKKVVETVATGDTALETGGTESGVIREIVWNGAIQIWQHYPIFGTGVETFAYSYYLYRPAAHNLTSEWDYIYNKAHNEFLNMAANSGTVGIVAYLVIIGFSIFIFVQKPKIEKLDNSLEIGNWKLVNTGLMAGYISLSASNFFGFSVVPTQLQFFLFPAIASVLAVQSAEYSVQRKKVETTQKVFIAAILITIAYTLYAVYSYWNADILYSKGKALNAVPRPDLAIPVLSDAIKLEPSQAIYYSELANSYTTVALAYDQAKNTTAAAQFTSMADSTIQNAVNLSPANINLRRTMFGVLVRLSTINGKYLNDARDSLIATINLAPTDPKLYYNLGILDANLGQYQTSQQDFQKAIDLKSNYSDARIEDAAVLSRLGKNAEAKEQLITILKTDPTNPTAKQALSNIK